MKTRNFFITMSLLVTASLFTQTTDDAIYFLENENGIGVKAQAMGNAFVSVADDYTAIYWNPAGLTLLKSSEMSGEFYHLRFNNQASFSGNTLLEDKIFTKLKSFGLAYVAPVDRGSLVLAFGYNRLKDYDDFLYFSGFNTIENQLAFDLEDEEGNVDLYPFDKNVLQTEQVIRNGNLGAYAVGTGIMLSPNFSMGATINFYSGTSKYYFDFYQDDTDNLYNQFPANYYSYEIHQYINSNFNALGIKLGGMLQLNNELRLGFAVDLPTSLKVKEIHGSRDVLIFDDEYISEMDMGEGKWEYVVKYPAKFSGGITLDLKQVQFAASANYRDWTDVQFDVPPGYFMTTDYSELLDENIYFKNQFRPVLSYSIGGEIKTPGTGLKIRGGYRVVPSPYIDATKDMDRQYYSAGFGYDIDKSTSINLSYTRGFWKRYSVDTYTPGGTFEEIETDKILAGITYLLK
jgi:long-subunit fatty acid transport protein